MKATLYDRVIYSVPASFLTLLYLSGERAILLIVAHCI